MAKLLSQNAIWQVLDQIRGRIPPNEYGVVLAALIFLRWADFQEAEQEAMAAFDDSDYEPVLPTKFHWGTWCDMPPRELEHVFRELVFALQGTPGYPDGSQNTKNSRQHSQLNES